MMNAIRPSDGTIKMLGFDSRKDAVKLHGRIGYLAGDMEMDRRLTGRQYLEYMANLRGGVPWSSIQKLVVRLQCQTNKKIAYLSRGNKQKIGLVSALMHNPDLLILDEPTSGLDPLIQMEFQKLIQEHTAQGKTAFISSHVLSEVQEICDHVGFIREGELVDVQPLKELERKAFKNVRITLSRTNKSALKGVEGLHDVQINGTEVRCKVAEHYQDLLKALAKLPVTNIVIEDANLDDLFLHYYQPSEAQDV